MKTATIMSVLIASAACWAQEMSLTVYNQDLALVRDVRTVTLQQGVVPVSFTDVASRIDPTSVHCSSLTAPGKFEVLEQNFEYDLVDAVKVMNKYIDSAIRVVTENGDAFQGTLLSVSGGDIVLSGKTGEITILRAAAIQHFDFPALPDGLVTRPTLNWLVRNTGPVSQKTQIEYLTHGISWHAEYVGVVNKGDDRLDLAGWVSIDNQSGKTYRNATLKLIAGDVNLVSERRTPAIYKNGAVMMAESAAPQFEEKSFFEYHMYTLQRRADVRDRQIKQLSLFPSASCSSDKIYVYDGARYGNKVRVEMEVANSSKNGLGIPLPKGKVRVYKTDSDGTLQFIGEDLIDHTPKNEKIRLFLGNVFDIVGERVRKQVTKVSEHAREEVYEITVRNRKEKSVEITVCEHAWGDWKIMESTLPYIKKDASRFEFTLTAPPDRETKLTYKLYIQY